VPDWAAGPIQTATQRVGRLFDTNPQDLIASEHSLQSRAAYDTQDLGGYDGSFGMATDLTRNASDMSWLQPQLQANTPFASGGKAYDYIDRYLNPYLRDVVDSSAADFDANAGRVRAQQALDLAGAEIERWPNSPDFYFALGDLYLECATQAPDRAATEFLPVVESAWKRCLEIGEQPGLDGSVPGRGSHMAAHNLAVFYETLGVKDLAVQHHAMAARLRKG